MSDAEDFIEPAEVESEEEFSEESDEEAESEPIIAEHPVTENQLHERIIIVLPEKRRTSDVLTRSEFTEILSIRGLQIAEKPIVLTDVTGLSDPIAMAEKELRDGKCPLILARKVGKGINNGVVETYVENWNANEMGIPPKF